MIKMLLAENFFSGDDAGKLYSIISTLNFQPSQYGEEVPDFNLVMPDLEPIFSRLLGEEVVIDKKNSGVFRRPMGCIHFESFSSPRDWVFYIALEPVTFNLYRHVETGAVSALEEHKLHYRNFLQWNYYTNILLNKNDGIFVRPWLFRSLNGGLCQVYRLTSPEQQAEHQAAQSTAE